MVGNRVADTAAKPNKIGFLADISSGQDNIKYLDYNDLFYKGDEGQKSNRGDNLQMADLTQSASKDTDSENMVIGNADLAGLNDEMDFDALFEKMKDETP